MITVEQMEAAIKDVIESGWTDKQGEKHYYIDIGDSMDYDQQLTPVAEALIKALEGTS